jgi:23S rRNA (cytidine1920-2'-O)/16S rRNA (cytidine1409-2'-O)-methyltransferase
LRASRPDRPAPARRTLRLDAALVARGLAPSRARARDAILRGHVQVDGNRADRPAQPVAPDARLAIDDPAAGYVSRGALKLIAALDHFGYRPDGRIALDLGASTGGFTEVLLARGARHVFAIDVGHGQLARRLAADPRVTPREGVNARDLQAGDVAAPLGAIVADVSFIPLRLALPAALALAASGAWGVFLIKPQFEVGLSGLGKGGIVRDRAAARAAAENVAAWLAGEAGWRVDGLIASPIAGGDGNHEFLLGGRRE